MKTNLGALLVVLLLSSCYGNAPDLNCEKNIDELKDGIAEAFDADSVWIQNVYIREEIYFEPIIAIMVTIHSPTTQILEFKTIPDSPVRFDNWEEIEEGIYEEGRPIAELIANSCEIDGFNDIYIRFRKNRSNGRIPLDFSAHYEYLAKEN